MPFSEALRNVLREEFEAERERNIPINLNDWSRFTAYIAAHAANIYQAASVSEACITALDVKINPTDQRKIRNDALRKYAHLDDIEIGISGKNFKCLFKPTGEIIKIRFSVAKPLRIDTKCFSEVVLQGGHVLGKWNDQKSAEETLKNVDYFLYIRAPRHKNKLAIAIASRRKLINLIRAQEQRENKDVILIEDTAGNDGWDYWFKPDFAPNLPDTTEAFTNFWRQNLLQAEPSLFEE